MVERRSVYNSFEAGTLDGNDLPKFGRRVGALVALGEPAQVEDILLFDTTAFLRQYSVSRTQG